MKTLITLFCLIALTSCQSTNWSLTKIKTVEGFNAPEAMLYDAKSDTVFISNIETSTEGWWADDKKAFISTMTADGQVKKMRWLNSSKKHPLHALKGMTILDGYLYFADISELKRCKISNPQKVETFKFPKAQHFNDITNDGQSILVSDTATGNIIRFFPETGRHTILQGPKKVNGITFADGKYYAVSFSEHDVYEIDITGEKAPAPFGLAEHFSNLDGIEVLEDGTFIISDLTGNAVFSLSPDRKKVKKLATFTWAADIGIDRHRGLIFVPSLSTNKVAIYQLVAE